MSALQIVALILANAPAAVRTLTELKQLVIDGFDAVKNTADEDPSIDELRRRVLALMAKIESTSAQIQNID